MKTILKLTALMGGKKPAAWYTLAGTIPTANIQRVYVAKGAASLAASYVNLVTPGTGDATAPTAAPDFNTATGWAFNEPTNTYLATGYTPTTNNMTFFLWLTEAITMLDAGFLMGMRNAAGADRMGFNMGAPTNMNFWNGTNASVYVKAAGLDAGVLAVSNKTAYINGSSVGTIAAGTSSGFDPFFIGCANQDGSRAYNATFKCGAVLIYDVPLTAGQVASLSTLIAAL